MIHSPQTSLGLSNFFQRKNEKDLHFDKYQHPFTFATFTLRLFWRNWIEQVFWTNEFVTFKMMILAYVQRYGSVKNKNKHTWPTPSHLDLVHCLIGTINYK